MQLQESASKPKGLLFLVFVVCALSVLSFLGTDLAWADEVDQPDGSEENYQLLSTGEPLPSSGILVGGTTYYVPEGGLTLTGKLTVPVGATVVIEPQVESGNGALEYSGINNIVVFGKLTINDVTIKASNEKGRPAINLVEENAEFYSKNMNLEQAGTSSGDGSSVAYIGIFVGDINNNNGGGMPNGTVISLKSSSVTMTGNGTVANSVRAVGHWNNATGSSIIIDNTNIVAAGYASNNAGYGQGVFTRPNYNSSVNVEIKNNSSILGFYYPVFCYSVGDTVGNIGSKNFLISETTITGYCGLYFRSDTINTVLNRAYGIVATIVDSDITARNFYDAYPSNSFPVLVTQGIYEGEFNISGTTLTAYSEKGAFVSICSPNSSGSQYNVFNFTDGCVLNCASHNGDQQPAFYDLGNSTIDIDSTVMVNGKLFDEDDKPQASILRGEDAIYYETFLAAMQASIEGDRIQLQTEISFTSDLPVSAGTANRTIDLNGKNFNLGTNSLIIDSGAKISIIDSTVIDDPKAAGIFTAAGITNNGSLSISGGVYKTPSLSVLTLPTNWCAAGYVQDSSSGAVGPVIYNITYDLKGGDAPSPDNPATYTVVTPTFTLSNPTKQDCSFKGWTGSNGSTPEATVTITKGSSTGLLNYAANWQVTVSFESNGGSLTPSLTIDEGQTATKPTDPTKTDSVFMGWYSDSALTTVFEFSTPLTQNKTLYAKWKAYDEFSLNEPSVPSLDTDHPTEPGVAVDADNALKLKKLSSALYMSVLRTGIATGVSDSDAQAIQQLFQSSKGTIGVTMEVQATPVARDNVRDEVNILEKTLNAGETLAQCYDIKIILHVTDSGTKGSSIDAILTALDEPLVFILHLDPALFKNTSARVLYVHDAKTDAEAKVAAPTTAYPLTGNIDVSSKEFSIYAIALTPQAQQVTVMFNSNGGTSVASQMIPAGSLATKPTPDPTKDNFIFAGWYSDSALTAAFDFSMPVNQSITLYAKWTPKDNPTPTPPPSPTPIDTKKIPGTGDMIGIASIALASCLVLSVFLLLRGYRKATKGSTKD